MGDFMKFSNMEKWFDKRGKSYENVVISILNGQYDLFEEEYGSYIRN